MNLVPFREQKPGKLSEGMAIFLVVAAIASFGGLLWVFQLHVPEGIEYVRSSLNAANEDALKPEMEAALWWDVAFMAGYVAAFVIAARLAAEVFRMDSGVRAAKWLIPLTYGALAANIVENALLILYPERRIILGVNLRDVASAASTLKFTCLVPAAAIAFAAVAITILRLFAAWRAPKRGAEIGVHPPITADDTQADRWRRGYDVPWSAHPTDGKRVLGISLSGGGIRSASVAMGAIQTMRRELEQARYLICVSGGSYFGGALQLAVGDEYRRAVFAPGSAEADHFRRHASYIADTPGRLLAAIGHVTKAFAASMVVLFGSAVLAGTILGQLYGHVAVSPWFDEDGLATSPSTRPGTEGLLVAVLVAATISYFFAQVWEIASSSPRRRPSALLRAAKVLVVFDLVVAALTIALPALVWATAKATNPLTSPKTAWFGDVTFSAPIGAVALTYVTTVIALLRRPGVREAATGIFRRISSLPGRAAQFLLTILTLAIVVVAWLLVFAGAADNPCGAQRTCTRDDYTTFMVLGIGALLLLIVDQTSLSLHPAYRSRLATLCLPRALTQAKSPDWKPDGSGDLHSLHKYGAVRSFPQVIYAAAANLTGEQETPLNASSFTLSYDYIGGPDVGYVNTDAIYGATTRHFKDDLSVEAAMAMSGGAFASAAGKHTRWTSALFAITGVRLGAWLPNPHALRELRELDGHWSRPRPPRLRQVSYLVREIFGRHSRSDRLLQITDGGHYDNLGLVEAFRRRCMEIYCIDGTGDQPPAMATLEEAINIAYLELGVRVSFEGPQPWNLLPGSAKLDDGPLAKVEVLAPRLADSAVCTATICYPPIGTQFRRQHGVLVLAKSRLTPEMSYEVLSYAARNPIFPKDTTGDQFFTDEQFSANLALGRYIGSQAVKAMDNTRRDPASVVCAYCDDRQPTGRHELTGASAS